MSTPETLKAALLSARRIAFSDPARGATVGTHFMKVIEALGIKDEVLKKATLAQDGVETMRLVLEGQVDLGVTQTSEIVQANPRRSSGSSRRSSSWRPPIHCGTAPARPPRSEDSPRSSRARPVARRWRQKACGRRLSGRVSASF